MNPDFDPVLLSRIEDASLNACAPPQQRWLDGWIVRFSPGKAKRARCINAVAPGRLSIEDKLALCRPVYDAAHLVLHVRITPFSQPEGLDFRLAALGLERQDDTRVMVCGALRDLPDSAEASGYRLDRLGHHAFAELIGRFRGSSSAERLAHAERLQDAPVPFQGFALIGDGDAAVACGQIAIEAELVGLYDVFTAEAWRGRRLARALCRQMLDFARNLGARAAYLQVEADNLPARRVYSSLGFGDAYAYHYRTQRTVPSRAEAGALDPGQAQPAATAAGGN